MQLAHSLSGQGWSRLFLSPLGDPGGVREGIRRWGIMGMQREAPPRLLLLVTGKGENLPHTGPLALKIIT